MLIYALLALYIGTILWISIAGSVTESKAVETAGQALGAGWVIAIIVGFVGLIFVCGGGL